MEQCDVEIEFETINELEEDVVKIVHLEDVLRPHVLEFRNTSFEKDNNGTDSDDVDWDVNAVNTTVTSITTDTSIDHGNEIAIEAGDGNGSPGPVKKRRKLRHKVDPALWKKNLNKSARMRGKLYYGTKKVLNEDGTTKKWDYNVPRNEKILKPRCKCTTNSSKDCSKIEESDRREIFKKFSELNWYEKRFFVCQHIECTQIARPRHRKKADQSRRQNTFTYYFQIAGVRFHVCQVFFLNTLNISKWSVHEWKLKQVDDNISPQAEKKKSDGSSARYKTHGDRRNHLESFLGSLVTVESHYCRKDTTRRFLEPIFNSKNQVYKLYTSKCHEDDLSPLSTAVFSQIFADMNLSIFKRKTNVKRM